MPTQVIPLEGIDKSGFISDTPAVNLPPGAWSDVGNVRFDDGAIRKFKGHQTIFLDAPNADGMRLPLFDNIRHITYWENPNERQYIVINRQAGQDCAFTVTLHEDGYGVSTFRGPFQQSDNWNSTQFNGGFSIIINNGRETPNHLSATTGVDLPDTATFLPLPGWASYLSDGSAVAAGNPAGTRVTAEILIANGNVLVAGGLIEYNNDTPVRSLNGLVRVSDVAAPGNIPQNWNPFDQAVGTADEIQIADTGTITAINSLRGSIFVYTSDTITQLRVTPAGLSSTVITTEFGAIGQQGVYEFRGQHFIIGSDDIYTFSGNPGDIKSVADGRVRKYFFDNINANFFNNTQIIRDQAFDELWVCYPTLDSADGSFDEALVWNYADNVWTKRDLPNTRALTIGPIPGGGSATTTIMVTGDIATVDTRDVQTVAITGTRSNVFSAASDAFFLRLPNNFQTGTTSTWNFDPDEGDTVYTTSVPTTTFSTGLTATTALAEISTTMTTLMGTGTPVETITTSILPADVTNVVDVPGNMTFTLSGGTGAVGDFNLTSYLGSGNTDTIETGIDLSTGNEGMVWIAISANDSNAGTQVYDTIRGGRMKLTTSANDAQRSQNDGLDGFVSNGWTNLAGSQFDSLNEANTDYISWTMRSGTGFFDIATYVGGVGVPPAGITSHELDSPTENGRIFDVVASGASGTSQINAGRITMMITGGGGGALLPSGASEGGTGGGGATAWATFDVQTGDVVLVTIGAAGASASRPGASVAGTGVDSVIRLQRTTGGVPTTEEIITAGGGVGGASNGGGGPGGTITVGTPTLTTIIASGGGIGGTGGNSRFVSGASINGGGGGAGGYSGAGGMGAFADGSNGADGAGGGGGGGGSSPDSNGGGGGGVGIYGEGANGAGGDRTTGDLRGGQGSGATVFAGSAGLGQPAGGGGASGAGGHGAFRLLSGSATATYPTTGVQNYLVRAIPHNLGAVPGMMLIKQYIGGNGHWVVWHKDLDHTNDAYFNLNEQQADQGSSTGEFFNFTEPTTTAFTVGNSIGEGSAQVNEDDRSTYINYIFGSDDMPDGSPDPNGSIYCGNYVGNSTSGHQIELGWEPAFVLLKADGGTDWFSYYDNNGTVVQDVVNNSTPRGLFTDPAPVSFNSTGFSLDTTMVGINGVTEDHYYMAVRAVQDNAASLVGNSVQYRSIAFDQTITTDVDLTDASGSEGGLAMFQNHNNDARLFMTRQNFDDRALDAGDYYFSTFGVSGNGSRRTLASGSVEVFGNNFLDLGTNPAVNDSGGNLYDLNVWKNSTGFFSHVVPEAPGGTPPTHVNVRHGLGATPAMVWVKTEQDQSATNPTRNWVVWHRDLGLGGLDSRNHYLQLGSTSDGIVRNDTWGTESDFQEVLDFTTTNFYLLGGDGNLNQGTSSYINVYSFGADGNTAAAGNVEVLSAPTADFITDHVVNLGWRPSFVLMKIVTASDGGGNNNENIGIRTDWSYWTTDRQATSVSDRNVVTLSLNRNSTTTGSGAMFTDTGFEVRTVVGDAGRSHKFIYYAVREGAVDAGSLPTFDLSDLGGNAVSLDDAGRAAVLTADDAAFITSVNAATTPGVNYTASADAGGGVQIVQDRWAGSDNTTHEIINSNAAFTSVVDNNTTNTRTQAAPSYRSGTVGYQEMLVSLGTPEALDSDLTVVRGDGGVGTQLFLDVDGAPTVGAPVGEPSVYTFISPGGGTSRMIVHAAAATDDVDTVGALIAADIENNVEIPEYGATYDVATDTITLTAADGGPVSGLWTFSAAHSMDVDNPDSNGDIAFGTVMNPTPGAINTADTITVTIPGVPSDRTIPAFPYTDVPKGQMVGQIRTDLNDYFNLFDEFDSAIVGDNVVVTHNQFGAGIFKPEVTYLDVTMDAPTNISASFAFADVDPERPWPNDVLNEARSFLVSGGSTNIFAMDLSNTFNGTAITSFIERRNFNVTPLQDTETLAGFYMNTDSTVPATTVFNVQLQGVDRASTPILYPGTGQTYMFNVADDYKIDTRINARLLNVRIENDGSDGGEWEIQSMATSVGKGGTR